MTYVLVSALASFIYVFLRAWQQINVQGRHYQWVVPTSVAMGIGDVVLILLIVKTDSLWMGVSNGLAAGLGCVGAMKLADRRDHGRNR
jgi:hypothetical protein